MSYAWKLCWKLGVEALNERCDLDVLCPLLKMFMEAQISHNYQCNSSLLCAQDIIITPQFLTGHL